MLLFVKYVSDKYTNEPFSSFKVPEGGSFRDMVALKNAADIGDKVNKIIEKLAEANGLKGVITITDFNNRPLAKLNFSCLEFKVVNTCNQIESESESPSPIPVTLC